ncbi:MAG: peptide chain release factor 3 [Candidatus Lambdaproteobacteria bacterium RIFOXYD2_FULL_50_16]|uniref:Peptide chain release factor 3 n=1 Tax=Candidatus Lambdaproteobacteria bacterium RIFOXYD2_FULL_50_16 TaxID=1817772 RepID=A0A1F6G6I6_9PROT|nr:MAG: peptide chain release factor 3 [Candidatus Lambdaproteobacteria bacterium RIFOXYD2_FULL_50_16]
MPPEIEQRIARQRTFAIISHPDAGKTTITEKLLLFGGAIQMAGTVKSRKSGRYATSDWMEIEKQRGISVTSSVMTFLYKGFNITLLDTPGHQDFSEDTYRVLTAVDSALMLIDGAKGVEAQTKKLLEVCRMRNTPVMTFINKFDRQCRSPFELLDEIEEVLGIQTSPITWPVGMGSEFAGVYHRQTKKLRIFKEGADRKEFDEVQLTGWDDLLLDKYAIGTWGAQFREEMELLEGAGSAFDPESYLGGLQTPVFFGSAMNSFGVQEFLDDFLRYAPGPLPRPALERFVAPEEPKLTGFIFKIQANMDPAHRDRVAFLRVCSGKFEKGMKVNHVRLERQIKLSKVMGFLAQDREQLDEAWPGEIIGLYDTGLFKIGDSFSEGEPLNFTGIPHFSPEHFMRVRLANPLKTKQLEKGLQQLTEEGATQVFKLQSGGLVLGVVGVLQFEVIKFRLLGEYGVEGVFEPVGYQLARWYHATDLKVKKDFESRYVGQVAIDVDQKPIFLCNSPWDLDYAKEKFKGMQFFANSDHIPA